MFDRQHCLERYITRKDALLRAASLLGESAHDRAVAQALRTLATAGVAVKWTAETVRDAVSTFILCEGRLPRASDFVEENRLPPHALFPRLFGKTLALWCREDCPSLQKKRVTRLFALRAADDLLAGEADMRERIREMEREYPITPWTVANVTDCLVTFVREQGHLPRKGDFLTDPRLPYPRLFSYRWGLPFDTWVETYCPFLKHVPKEAPHVPLAVFCDEYRRLLPTGKRDFDRRRDPNRCPCTDTVLRRLGIRGWANLLTRCGLTPPRPSDKCGGHTTGIRSVSYEIV